MALALLIFPLFSVNAQINTRVEKVVGLPIPKNSIGPAVDWNKGYYLEKISDHAYYATEGVYQFMFLVTQKGVVVFDAPPSIGENMLKAIKEVTNNPITTVIYTHWHPDHSGGAYLFPKNATYITSKKAADELKKHNVAGRSMPSTTFGTFVGGKLIPNATKTFTGEYTFSVDGNPIKLIEIKSTGHSEGDIIVTLPDEKVAMVVDYVTPGWIIWEDWGYALDLQGYYDAMLQIKSIPFEKFVSGHLNAIGTKKDVELAIEYFNDVKNEVATAMQSTTFQDAGGKTGYDNKYVLSETFFDLVAKKATDKVVSKWKDKIAGVDVWAYNHSRKMITYLRYN